MKLTFSFTFLLGSLLVTPLTSGLPCPNDKCTGIEARDRGVPEPTIPAVEVPSSWLVNSKPDEQVTTEPDDPHQVLEEQGELEARADCSIPDFQMGLWDNRFPTKTWYKLIDNTGTLDQSEIKQYAEKAYDQVKGRFGDGIVMAGSLHVPNIGILVASKPRPVYPRAQNEEQLAGRKQQGLITLDLLHVEDFLAITAVKLYKENRKAKPESPINLPTGAKGAVWGKYNTEDQRVGLKRPYGSTGAATIDPSCDALQHELNINWITS
ncbi:uncharacterized protein ASPGLDRAFT_55332 [Aspergillus glaucus CBS 516.65]|uniref:Uncharacterized protein n=1 Tax=Aspergillus glaucus CBS 516.65 TaxID=1160497 RepID=A0A1L9VW11_ASPGL|nr:hypothetical protein ASPGLDRAFT_55332 [Aspergillus glaucus CBS 516.65]OJJ88086.1 hypothetical protein ASPGLDRAFT_55332 [Aspergillus glaucus CBS 516.65]